MQWSVIPTDVFYTMRFSAYSFCVMLFVQSEVPNDQDISAYAAPARNLLTHEAEERRAASARKRILRGKALRHCFAQIPFIGHDL